MNRRHRRLVERALQRANRAEFHEPYGDSELPIDAHKHEIIEAIRDNQVTKISGPTGTGKSTITSLLLLDAGRDSVMMQPRRLAAHLVADRMAHLVAKKRGGNSDGLVGCLTADVNTLTPNTRASVVTSGVLLLQLQELLSRKNKPVLIFDEAHEWGVDLEIALALTKQAMHEDPDMRVVIMSATPDNQVIDNFFADVVPGELASINIEGETHPIEDRAEPASTIAEQAFLNGQEGKSILAFVKGKQQIEDVIDDIKARFKAAGGQMPVITPLHAKSSPAVTKVALGDYPKIVVTTNVAETSVTIPGIDIVIDGGLKNEPHIDGELSDSVDPELASRSEMRQRRGRCGRLKEGLYIVTRESEEELFMEADNPRRPEHSKPEIQRMKADRVVLYAASLGLDIDDLEFPHRIDSWVIEEAKRSLKILGALDYHDDITQLGRHMQGLHVAPELARMVVASEQYSAMTRAQMAAITASVEVGGLQYFAHNVGKRWKDLVEQDDSDMIAQLELFIATMHMDKRQQVRHDLDVQNIDRAQRQYRKIMKKIGIDPEVLAMPTPNEVDNLNRCIYAGMVDHAYSYQGSNVYVRANGRYVTPREISNRSVVKQRPAMIVGYPYRFEYLDKGEEKTKHIVETVTRVSTPAVLGEIAAHLCVWLPSGHVWRGGSLMQRETQYMNDTDLGVVREVEAAVTKENIAIAVKHIMDNPGSALRELYGIQATIKTLQKLSPNAPTSIDEKIREIVVQAVTESNLDESYADHIIRNAIYEQDISLGSYISDESLAHIYENSPGRIEAYDQQFTLSYERGVPLIKRSDLTVMAQLPGEVVLPDGRVVKFVGEHGKRFTVAELQSAGF